MLLLNKVGTSPHVHDTDVGRGRVRPKRSLGVLLEHTMACKAHALSVHSLSGHPLPLQYCTLLPEHSFPVHLFPVPHCTPLPSTPPPGTTLYTPSQDTRSQ